MTPADRTLAALATSQCGAVSSSQALAAGLTRAELDWRLACGRWRRLLHGVYLVEASALGLDASADWAQLPFATRLHAAAIAHGPRSVACLDTAVVLHGLPAPPRHDGTIHLRLPVGLERHQVPGIRIHTGRVDAADVVRIAVPGTDADTVPIPSTGLHATLADVLRAWGDWDAVAAVDHAVNTGQLLGSELDSALEAWLAGRRGAVSARTRIGMSDGRSCSPLETRIRLIARAAGLPPDHIQHPVHDRWGVLLGVADLAWDLPGGRLLVAEADGRRWHDAPAALYRDRRRANDFVGTGLVDLVRFTWEDTWSPAYVGTVLGRHLRRGRSPRRS